MKYCSSWLFYDRENNIWKFYINDNKDLMFSIMYGDDKWTKESKIDSDVIDFAIDIDKDYELYIIYSTKNGELKYCIWKNDQWYGKTLYSFENKSYEMYEITINTVGQDIHIFFIAKSTSSDECFLMHFYNHNKKNVFNTVGRINLAYKMNSHYQTEVSPNGSIYVIFADREEDKVDLRITKYEEHKWINPKKIYSIDGKDINFCTIMHNHDINILNVSRDDSNYSIEHAIIKHNGSMKVSTIYEGPIKLKNYLLFELDRTLYAMWSDGEKIMYSSYDDGWNEVLQYGGQVKGHFAAYKYLSVGSKYKNLHAKCVIVNDSPDVRLVICNNKNLEKSIVKSLKKSNKDLEKRLVDINMQLQRKERIIGESENNFTKLTLEKKKMKEKLDVIVDIQKGLKCEIEKVRKEKAHMENSIDDMENIIDDLKSKLKSAYDENRKIHDENKKIKEELELEKNRGIVDIILKKKTSSKK